MLNLDCGDGVPPGASFCSNAQCAGARTHTYFI